MLECGQDYKFGAVKSWRRGHDFLKVEEIMEKPTYYSSGPGNAFANEYCGVRVDFHEIF